MVLIGDRIVVMDFVYTTCTTICPVLSAVFGQLQNKLGERLGDDVVLVSLDPEVAAYLQRVAWEVVSGWEG